jgi:hypothetical protein
MPVVSEATGQLVTDSQGFLKGIRLLLQKCAVSKRKLEMRATKLGT